MGRLALGRGLDERVQSAPRIRFSRRRLHAGVLEPNGAVRLKYAGVESAPAESDPGRALDALIEATPEGETAHLLCTYTAMLELRAELVRRGWAKPYWETCRERNSP